MNRVAHARRKLLQGNFLCSDDLTQNEYEVVTDPRTRDSVILAMFDAKTGGHLSNRVQNSLDDGPFFCLDERQAETEEDDEGEEPASEELTEPTAPLSLTPVSASPSVT